MTACLPEAPDHGGAVNAAESGPLQRFTAIVVGDADLATRLAAIEDGVAFIAEAVRSAREHDIVLPEESLVDAAQRDPLGLARLSAPSLAGPALPPRDWLPMAVAADSGAMTVDWAWFGPEPLRASFYEDDIRRALRLPFNRAFRYRTGLADLVARAETLDSRAPDGFIFHMSRCGSTLVGQMLATLPDSIVIAEAAPLDAVLQLGRGSDDAAAARALRAMVLAFGRRRSGRERRYVVKLDCWHTLALPVYRRAFPDVPWVFLYRDPVEVLVSQMRQRGMQMVPQFFPPSFFGIGDEDSRLDGDYCARVLAAICRAVIEHQHLGSSLFLNYRQLPDAVSAALLPHFGISCNEEEQEAMRRVTKQNAKSPGMPFTGDAEVKQRAATATDRDAAARHLGEIYDRLESLCARPQLNVAT